jgi:hypothetical protein
MGVRLIRPHTGQYMTHCNGKSVSGVLDKYESILDDLRISHPESGELRCSYTRSESFVASFLEVWVFYKLRMI